jgi:hypothetical protein
MMSDLESPIGLPRRKPSKPEKSPQGLPATGRIVIQPIRKRPKPGSGQDGILPPMITTVRNRRFENILPSRKGAKWTLRL